MSLRFLIGPERQLSQRLPLALQRGDAAAFTEEQLARANSWEALLASLPEPFQPDFLALDVSYRVVPEWLASAPVPVIGLAGDSSLLWHGYRELPGVDLLLCDTVSAERLSRQGLTPALAANLYGVEQVYFEESADDGPRDIDVLFCGNLSSACQSERLPWLQRIARLRERWNVQIVVDAWGADYRALMRRARIVFNRSVRSEWNRRVSESLAAGALTLIERGNVEVSALLRDRVEAVFYDETDLESRIEHYLTHEDERQNIAATGHARAAEFSFEAQWQRTLARIEAEWPQLQERGRTRPERPDVPALLARTWRAASAHQWYDATLAAHIARALEASPRNADLHNALGVAVALEYRFDGRVRTEAARLAFPHFRQALVCDERHGPAAINTIETLIAMGEEKTALETAQRALMQLDRDTTAVPAWLDAPRFPPDFDRFHAEWQKAGWDHPNDRAAEARVKRSLMRWWLTSRLGTLSNDPLYYHEAVHARPDVASSNAALGCALARANRTALSLEHLRAAVESNPFDLDAARALYQTRKDCGDEAGCGRLARDQWLLSQVAPAVVAVQPWFEKPASEDAKGLRVETLTGAQLRERFGELDTSKAIHSFTPPEDTHAVLTLLAHLKPQRIVEIGTAEGHMTANLTEWSPDEATVYTLGITREMQGACRPEQGYEAPPREVLGRLAGHFGKGDKVFSITADSAGYNFKRLAPIDFAFIDGAHDLEHVLADTRNVYANLRVGGVMVWHDFGSKTSWVEVNEALAQAHLPEPIQHVAGTQVAFLIKQEQPAATNGEAHAPHQPASRARPADSNQMRVVWEGGIAGVYSLALVNRELCKRLLGQELELNILPAESHPIMGIAELPLPAALTRRFRRPLSRPADVHVRHRWPVDFRPPAEGHFVVMQPWEYGSIPRVWADMLTQFADEVWAPTKYVRDCFVEGGVPAERVAVVPLGVDVSLYRPEAAPLPLKTRKTFKFLFVGGTIQRKGIDVLLAAYGKAFTAADDVCLVIKDMGNGSFYRGQTAEEAIARFRAEPDAPEIEYLTRSLSFEELAGLYTACDCLVHPYRGEGFGLPIAEAMACGKPVIVTGMGAALDFCNETNAYLIPARRVNFSERNVSGLETAGTPWLAEPSPEALVELMRRVVAEPEEAQARGTAGCAHVRANLTWDRAAAIVEERLRSLRQKPIHRFQPRPAPSSNGFTITRSRTGRIRVTLTMIVKNEEHNIRECLASISDLVDEIVIVDTGSTDRTKEIAASFGSKVKIVDFPWIDDFAAARNKALEHATGDFIIWMDADDRIDEPNREKLRRLFAQLPDANVACSLKCVCPGDHSGPNETVVDHVRIFRNHPDIRWRYRVHEQILGAVRRTHGEVRFEDIFIIHMGYLDAPLRARKLQRDLRILRKAYEEDPNEPFTLFNLGMIHNDQGQYEQALEFLERSLQRSDPGDSIVRKLYAMMGGCHLGLGKKQQALNVYNEGLAVCPDDAELLFRHAILLRDMGDYTQAEASLHRLLSTKPDPHFASIDPALRGWRGRHELALLLMAMRRYPEAQAEWRQVVRDHPGIFAAWLGLADVAIELGDRAELDQVAAQLERFQGGALQAEILRGRFLFGKGDVAEARALAEKLVSQYPREIGGRVLLARALREQRQDRLAEEAWRAVLKLDPCHAEARAHLSDLLRMRMRSEDDYFEAMGQLNNSLLGEHYQAACLSPSDLQAHLSTLHELARDCKHITDAGTGQGLSALAFLWAHPEKLVCLDVVHTAAVDHLAALAGMTKFIFRKADTLTAEIEETDMLFLDTKHDASQLREELRRHAGKVRIYLVLHGTTAYVVKGESPRETGIWPVVEEFLAQGSFRLHQRHESGQGLTVLERITPTR